ncbi:SpoIIE family protein phosphatase [Microbacterium stercoris]|uniref:SpoIIE family protein phosphatase n=1 Tax=Microbacterium stercoris TaxID=2820289 RepID=A0A939TX01_9MICO|nr:SpoIIE family protein phosphatase [Microbacterium stercoris]MBO3663167.1 SpoIIE family protein phosphatase [Microbacterium stercoris]
MGESGSALRADVRAREFGATDVVMIAAFAVGYVVAAVIGRLTLLSDSAISAVWPAAAVSVLWVVARAGRAWFALDHVLIAVLTVFVALATGATPVLAVSGGLAAAVQTIVCSWIIWHGCRRVWREGGSSLRTRAELWWFITAALAGPFASGPLLEVQSLLSGDGWNWGILLLWFGRNVVSILALCPLGFVIADGIRHRRSGVAPQSFAALGWSVRSRPIEWVAVLILVPAVYWFWFTALEQYNVVFPLLALACVSGMRLPQSIVMLQGVLITVVIVVLSAEGRGPFGDVGDTATQLAAAQLYVVLVIVIGLALATERDSRELLVRELARASENAETQASLLETIIDTITEGVRVVRPDGSTIIRNRAALRLLFGREDGPSDLPDAGDLQHVRDINGHALEGDHRELFEHLPDKGSIVADLLIHPPGIASERVVTFTATRLPAPAEGVVTVLRDVTAEQAELRRAAQVQAGLLPTDAPRVPGYDLAARFVPAGSVGGDFYDWYSIDHGVVLTLADVMGKGMGAAILAATTRSLLRAHGGGEDVLQPLVEAERGMARDLDNAGAFVTVFRSFVHAPTGDVTYVDAGHGLTAVLSRDGSARRLESNGLPLGIVPDEVRTVAHERLAPGDVLLVVSDGVLDAVGGSLDDLAEVWAELPRDLPVAALVEAVVERASAGQVDDDLTVLALRRSPDAGSQPPA